MQNVDDLADALFERVYMPETEGPITRPELRALARDAAAVGAREALEEVARDYRSLGNERLSNHEVADGLGGRANRYKTNKEATV